MSINESSRRSGSSHNKKKSTALVAMTSMAPNTAKTTGPKKRGRKPNKIISGIDDDEHSDNIEEKNATAIILNLKVKSEHKEKKKISKKIHPIPIHHAKRYSIMIYQMIMFVKNVRILKREIINYKPSFMI